MQEAVAVELIKCREDQEQLALAQLQEIQLQLEVLKVLQLIEAVVLEVVVNLLQLQVLEAQA
jgi:hypothetical protein